MKIFIFLVIILSLAALTPDVLPYQAKGGKALSLSGTIQLAGVSGRIDHMAFDSGRQFIYVAALGNNSVEVIDLKNKKIVHSIKGMSEPQGIRYISESNAIFIANGSTGECDIFDADSCKKITSVRLESDADNVRYDPVSSRIYVGYGEGGIAIIDAKSFKQLESIELPGHPESFQLDTDAGKLFVNIPDSKILATIDLTNNTVTHKWKIEIASANFPMALDSKNHRLFIGCRNPSELLILNSETGKTIDNIDINADADDIFYDSFTRQIFVSCGSGYIDIIKQFDPDKYEAIQVIESLSGARTSLFIPELNQLIIASPERPGRKAQLLIFDVR